MRIMICEDETVYACALTNSIMRWKNNLHIKSLELETFHSAEDLLEKLHQNTGVTVPTLAPIFRAPTLTAPTTATS